MKVSDIFKEKVISVSKQCSIRDAARIMAREHIGDLIVTDNDSGTEARPVGIVTDRDIVVKLIAAGGDVEGATVGDLLGAELMTARQNDDLDDVMSTMRRYGINRMPVLDEKGHLSGILTANDILKALTRELSSVSVMSEGQHQREEHHQNHPHRPLEF